MTRPRPQPEPRSRYRHSRRVTTRWLDNGALGHVNTILRCLAHGLVDRAGRQPVPLPAAVRDALQPLVCHP